MPPALPAVALHARRAPIFGSNCGKGDGSRPLDPPHAANKPPIRPKAAKARRPKTASEARGRVPTKLKASPAAPATPGTSSTSSNRRTPTPPSSPAPLSV